MEDFGRDTPIIERLKLRGIPLGGVVSHVSVLVTSLCGVISLVSVLVTSVCLVISLVRVAVASVCGVISLVADVVASVRGVISAAGWATLLRARRVLSTVASHS